MDLLACKAPAKFCSGIQKADAIIDKFQLYVKNQLLNSPFVMPENPVLKPPVASWSHQDWLPGHHQGEEIEPVTVKT